MRRLPNNPTTARDRSRITHQSREGLDPLQDGSRWAWNRRATEVCRGQVQTAVPANLDEKDVKRRSGALEEWVERFNDELSAVEKILERLDDMKTDAGAGYQRWDEAVGETAGRLQDNLPRFDVPELDGQLPVAFLHDSARDYVRTSPRFVATNAEREGKP